MRILELLDDPVADVLFQAAGARGRPEVQHLLVQRARADRLPDGATSMLITSDLQGIAPSWSTGGEARLLGEVVAETMFDLIDSGVIADPGTFDILLAGDLYSAPGANERGASGDVTSVWQAMSQVARRVIGVQGNHDTFSSTFRQLGTCHLLDGTSTGSIAGVSLIAGNVDKPGRRSEAEQARRIREVTRHAPEVLLLHEGPPGTGAGERGSRFIIDALHEAFDGLIICGHCHWPTPLSTCAEHQVLNVDARAILVTT